MESDTFYANTSPLHILLADDDDDDQFFFQEAMTAFSFEKKIDFFINGEYLLTYLSGLKDGLPDLLFLDYNLPRRNGLECLVAIKKHPVLKAIPVIMYSTYVHEDTADVLYQEGAHFFARKSDLKSMVKIFGKIFTSLLVKKLPRPDRSAFIITA